MAEPASKICAQCETDKGKLVRCTGCYSVHYCGAECQRKAWTLHKPDCLEAQGKPVSDAVRAKADLKIKEAQAQAQLKQAQSDERYKEFEKRHLIIPFQFEVGHVNDEFYDIDTNNKRRAHLRHFGLAVLEYIIVDVKDMKFESNCRFVLFPDGIDANTCSPKGWLLTDHSNKNATIILLIRDLFANPSTGSIACQPIAYAIDGLFVIDHVYETFGKNRAFWKKVEEPSLSNLDGVGVRYHWLCDYVAKAKNEAMAVDEYVDLGFIDAGKPLSRYHVTAEGVEQANPIIP
jgi:Fe-S-cluster containining protein